MISGSKSASAGGENLIAEARAFPNLGFIGCEPYVNGMAKILAQIEAHNIGNIRLFAGDATELLAWAPPCSLKRLDLIHPDPWPKRRHWKRRFVQDATVAAIARALKPSGEFRFVSDMDGYSAWPLAHLWRSPDFVWPAEPPADWRLPWTDYTMTRYGRKAEREGRNAAYLRFRSVSYSRELIPVVSGRSQREPGMTNSRTSGRLAGLPEIHHPLRGRRHQARGIYTRALGVRWGRAPGLAQTQE